MNFLSILKSKTVWGAIALGAVNTLPVIAPYVQGTPVGAGINLALAGFTIYGRIRAKQPLGPVIDDTIAKTIEAVNVIDYQPDSVRQPNKVATIVKATNVSVPLSH